MNAVWISIFLRCLPNWVQIEVKLFFKWLEFSFLSYETVKLLDGNLLYFLYLLFYYPFCIYNL